MRPESPIRFGAAGAVFQRARRVAGDMLLQLGTENRIEGAAGFCAVNVILWPVGVVAIHRAPLDLTLPHSGVVSSSRFARQLVVRPILEDAIAQRFAVTRHFVIHI